jgi:hypothetical protein
MRAALFAAALAAIVPDARAQETPQDIVRRAIQAHGGRDNLAKLMRYYARAHGSHRAGDSWVPLDVEVWNDLPRRAKLIMREDRGLLPPAVFTSVDDEASGWMWAEGQPAPQEMTGEEWHFARNGTFAALASRLFPLLEDPRFTLSSLGSSVVEGRAAVGVKAVVRGADDILLYFDKTTGLLMKTEYRVLFFNAEGRFPFRVEDYWDDYQDVAGTRFPMRKRHLCGDNVFETEYSEVRPVASFDDKVFARP